MCADIPRPHRRDDPDGFSFDDDPRRIDVGFVHAFLVRSYWATGIPLETVRRSIQHSMPVGVYSDAGQVGFARVITDRTTFAYLSDVFVIEEQRGKGLSKRLVAHILSHPELQNLRRWHLVTFDAHGLYSQFGFQPLERPERHMQMHLADAYSGISTDSVEAGLREPD